MFFDDLFGAFSHHKVKHVLKILLTLIMYIQRCNYTQQFDNRQQIQILFVLLFLFFFISFFQHFKILKDLLLQKIIHKLILLIILSNVHNHLLTYFHQYIMTLYFIILIFVYRSLLQNQEDFPRLSHDIIGK